MPSAKEEKETLLRLADVVQREATAIADLCAANESPLPSLTQDWPDSLPENIQVSRMKLREAAKALYDISVGPFDHLFSIAWGVRFSIFNYPHFLASRRRRSLSY